MVSGASSVGTGLPLLDLVLCAEGEEGADFESVLGELEAAAPADVEQDLAPEGLPLPALWGPVEPRSLEVAGVEDRGGLGVAGPEPSPSGSAPAAGADEPAGGTASAPPSSSLDAAGTPVALREPQAVRIAVIDAGPSDQARGGLAEPASPPADGAGALPEAERAEVGAPPTGARPVGGAGERSEVARPEGGTERFDGARSEGEGPALLTDPARPSVGTDSARGDKPSVVQDLGQRSHRHASEARGPQEQPSAPTRPEVARATAARLTAPGPAAPGPAAPGLAAPGPAGGEGRGAAAVETDVSAEPAEAEPSRVEVSREPARPLRGASRGGSDQGGAGADLEGGDPSPEPGEPEAASELFLRDLDASMQGPDLLLDRGALTHRRAVRVEVDRDLTLEVSYDREDVEVSLDGTPEALRHLAGMERSLSEDLEAGGWNLRQFDARERRGSGQPPRQQLAEPAETGEVEGRAAPSRQIQRGALLNRMA